MSVLHNLTLGFHQIQIDKKDTQNTVFTIENGHFEFIRLPFILTNALSISQRKMDNILWGFRNKKYLEYRDDILVYSPRTHKHLNKLGVIFERLLMPNIKIQTDKCQYLEKDADYLGYLITREGVTHNRSQIECVVNFRNLSTNKAQIFLDNRCIIFNFTKVSKPQSLKAVIETTSEKEFDSLSTQSESDPSMT